jgi:hypothetical protein
MIGELVFNQIFSQTFMFSKTISVYKGESWNNSLRVEMSPHLVPSQQCFCSYSLHLLGACRISNKYQVYILWFDMTGARSSHETRMLTITAPMWLLWNDRWLASIYNIITYSTVTWKTYFIKNKKNLKIMID